MITTEIYKGQGLGNQLWCYVVTRVVALDNGYKFGVMHPENIKSNSFMNLDFGCEVVGGDGPEGGPPVNLPKGINFYYKEKKILHPDNSADISVFDKNLIDIPDNTKLDGNMQDEKYIYHRKDEIRKWLKVETKKECFDFSDKNICVINFRGGEYVYIKNIFLTRKYWDDAIKNMLKINPNFRFVVITDDVKTAKNFFPKFEVYHFNIAKDYSIVNNARYLILSNSSFAWFPAWLSISLEYCIAPKYWWSHNNSDGYWSCGYNITKGWFYQDRNGRLFDYGSCVKEFNKYKNKYKIYKNPVKIYDNFVVISDFNNDINWLMERTNNYVIYNKTDSDTRYSYLVNKNRVIQSKNAGYNLYDYFTYIIDNYENLPNCVEFLKGNVFPRHVSEIYFDNISNSKTFTPIENIKVSATKLPNCFVSSDGGFNEINNSWYMNHYPSKFFKSYNDFLKFCFVEPVIPRYIRFAPGGNYIVPRRNLLKLSKVFYENLRLFVSYCPLPAEAHIIERALYTLWNSDYVISRNMLSPIDVNKFPKIFNPKRSKWLFIGNMISLIKIDKKKFLVKLKEFLPMSVKKRLVDFFNMIKSLTYKIYPLDNLVFTVSGIRKYIKSNIFIKRNLVKDRLVKFNKKYKIYDAFYFFNELELLEIRLNILDKYVDYFVIVESTETFSGLPKRLFYEENKERFIKFQHKIIHYVVRDTPRDEVNLRSRLYNINISPLDKEIIINTLTSDNVPSGESHWLKEFYQKESLKKALVNLKDNDFVYVSDVDEIWNPEAKIDYSRDDLYKCKQVAYYYYLNNRSNDDWMTGWTGTVMTKYINIKNACINHLRTHNKNHYSVVSNGGWHFTFLGGVKRIEQKLESMYMRWLPGLVTVTVTTGDVT